jgi:thiamine biosynthesis protein ThiI
LDTQKVVLRRFGEIFLKGDNRAYFERLLQENIESALAGVPCEVKRTRGRYLVDGIRAGDLPEIESRLKKVFGIHSFSVASRVRGGIDQIYAAALACAQNKRGTFKIETRRADKTFPLTSLQVSAEIGGRILEACQNLTVDVVSPNHTVYIDIRESGETFVFSDTAEGAHGLPTGCAGRGLLFLSGGIDSPVAGYMMAKRGMKLSCLHFHSYPYTGEPAREKAVTLCKKLAAYNGKTEMYVVNLKEIQEAIHKNCAEAYMITLMRRFMMRIGERLAGILRAGALINGESLGQVASQTLESINVTNAVVRLPVFRPLIGFDKQEIIDIASRIGTYETSILPYEDCCTVFLPKRPAIRPHIEEAKRQECFLAAEDLIQTAINTAERQTVS